MPDSDAINNILIIQFRPFGDVLLTTPILPVICKHYPKAVIHFLVLQPYHTILKYVYGIDKIWHYDSYLSIFKRIKKIKNTNFDIVLDYSGSNISALLALILNPRERVGYRKGKFRDKVYTITATHLEKRYSALMKFDLLKSLGIYEESTVFPIQLPTELTSKVKERLSPFHNMKKILISPNSPRPHKRWRIDYFREVVIQLARDPRNAVFVLQGPGEKEYVDILFSHLSQEVAPHINRLAPAEINELLAWIQQMDLYIGNCGGPKHMAVAMNTPSITIFGPTDEIVWHPHHLSNHIALINHEKRFRDDSFGILPDDVLQAANRLLNQSKE